METPIISTATKLLLLLIYFLFTPSWFNCSSRANNTSEISGSDVISINCGSADSVSYNGVYWRGDVGSELVTKEAELSTLCVSSGSSRNIPQVPYLTARIFHNPFVYSFPTSPGVKFIKLHFYPGSYLGDVAKAYFSATCGRFTLLGNFNPSVTSKALKLAYFSKEFSVPVKEHRLNITFIPSLNVTKAFAFVNGIEVKSMAFSPFVGALSNASSKANGKEPAFEMLYRVNVGGYVDRDSDSEQLPFMNWVDDSNYIIGPATGATIFTEENISYRSWSPSEFAAPTDLYVTARTMGEDDSVNMNNNLTWAFPVDSGFSYLIRLHFCEIAWGVSEVNDRVFQVYINNDTVEKSLDLVALLGNPLVATHKDYYVTVPEIMREREVFLLSLHPSLDTNPKFANVILNGIEIIKIVDKNGNLAAHAQLEDLKMMKNRIPWIVILPVFIGGCILLLVMYLIIKKLATTEWMSAWIKKFHPGSHINPQVQVQIETNSCCRKFELAEIVKGTRSFSDAHLIGVGGFGKVFKGFLMYVDGHVEVAIKRANPQSRQGIREFQSEILLLSTFRHANVVSLLGFCQEEKELILVYEYMRRGTLRDHLYNTHESPLSWTKRLQICIGAARGVHYLHTGTEFPTIHRDIKSSNILLDQNWVAKVSDFGLSRIGPTTASNSHISTEVKGTFGYLDPRYYRTRKLTAKSDVYSFGVVLFEVLCARPAVNPKAQEDDEKISLAEWALNSHKNGVIDEMIDPYIRGTIASESLNTFVDTAVKCLSDKRTERPSMGDVLAGLEKALQFHETVETICLE